MSDEKTHQTARRYVEDMLDYAAEVGIERLEIRVPEELIGVEVESGVHYLMGVDIVKSAKDGSTSLPRYYISRLEAGADEYKVVAHGCDYGELYENTISAINTSKPSMKLG